MRNHPLPIDISVAISNLSQSQNANDFEIFHRGLFCDHLPEKLSITKLIDTAYRNGPIVVIDDDDEFDPRETTV